MFTKWGRVQGADPSFSTFSWGSPRNSQAWYLNLLSEQRDASWRRSDAIGIHNRAISTLGFRQTRCLHHVKEEWQHAVGCPGGVKGVPDRPLLSLHGLSEEHVLLSHLVAW